MRVIAHRSAVHAVYFVGGTRGRLGLLVPEETDQTVAWVRTPGLCLQSSKGLRWPGAGLAHLYV